ncbi:hypothetical protein L484_014521 [Morus notabilis]|uniref:Uncharacterized protein n=1 Tax=Morus notabilis TaxID=981085 RepID=W9S9M1_9ROSA|nr:hypothetical protein L484_014521 [Morus notabilis]
MQISSRTPSTTSSISWPESQDPDDVLRVDLHHHEQIQLTKTSTILGQNSKATISYSSTNLLLLWRRWDRPEARRQGR